MVSDGELLAFRLRLGERIRQRRQKLGLSTTQLAERTGAAVTKSAISLIENAKVDCRVSSVLIIASALEMSEIELLFGFTDNEKLLFSHSSSEDSRQ